MGYTVLTCTQKVLKGSIPYSTFAARREIIDHYVLRKRIGSGGYGTVYLGNSLETGETVSHTPS